jgi:hypothetical protein
MNCCKYKLNPLSYHPGGSKLTFVFRSGKIYKTHNKVKYPDKYATTVVKNYLNALDPITLVICDKTLIYEKN